MRSEAERKKAKAESDRRYYMKNRKNICASVRAHEKANPEKVRAAHKQWAANNIEKVRESQKKWSIKNVEQEERRVRSNYLDNRGRRLAEARAWQIAHPEERKAILRRYRTKHKEKIKEKNATYSKIVRMSDPDKFREQARDYYARNTAKRYAYFKKWYAANRVWRNACGAERKAARKTATPSWVDRSALKEIYVKARTEGLTVDHIVPLKHALVCGLHVPVNLQLLSHAENSRKTNTFEVA